MSQFYSEEIEVRFPVEPAIEKRPGLPSAFTWRGRDYQIVELLEEWHDYRPRGRSQAMYKKEKGAAWVERGKSKGSWGVGRDYYRVKTEGGEVFDIYYDRTPKGSERKGGWVLYRRIEESQ